MAQPCILEPENYLPDGYWGPISPKWKGQSTPSSKESAQLSNRQHFDMPGPLCFTEIGAVFGGNPSYNSISSGGLSVGTVAALHTYAERTNAVLSVTTTSKQTLKVVMIKVIRAYQQYFLMLLSLTLGMATCLFFM